VVGITPKYPNRAAFCAAGCDEATPLEPLCFGEDDEYDPKGKCGPNLSQAYACARFASAVLSVLRSASRKHTVSPWKRSLLPRLLQSLRRRRRRSLEAVVA